MSDGDDIVERLCVLNHHAKKLAEIESLHDLYREAFERCEKLTWEAAKKIKELRRERDAARRDICARLAETRVCAAWRLGRDHGKYEEECRQEANRQGWDCFEGSNQ